MLPLPACICVPHNADWFYSIKVTLIACSAEETAAVSDLKLLKVQNLKVEMSGGTKAEHSRKKKSLQFEIIMSDSNFKWLYFPCLHFIQILCLIF